MGDASTLVDAAIAVNGRFRSRPITGVERYAREIVARLPSARTIEPPVRGSTAGHVWEQLALPTSLRRGELLWSPANAGPIVVAHQVVTIHDVSVLEHPEWFSRPFAAWYGRLLPRLARRVRHILTVSEFSRQRILNILAVDPNRVTSIRPGVGPQFTVPTPDAVAQVRQRHDLPERYVLALGSLEPRKNVDGLLRAWTLARPVLNSRGAADHAAPTIDLVVAGAEGPQFRRMSHDASPGVRMIGRPDDADLPGLYGGADAFVYPSLYEGFGLPVLEAMACGAAVVASDAGGIPEAAGDAAMPFSPDEPAALAAALVELLSSHTFRGELRARGLARARQFSWDVTAARIADVLQRIASLDTRARSFPKTKRVS